MKEIYLSKSKHIVLDCKKEKVRDVLLQAQQVGLVAEGYYYLITNLDAHTLNLEEFKVKNWLQTGFILFNNYWVIDLSISIDCYNAIFQFGGTNFTAFSLVDTNSADVKNIVMSMVNRNLGKPIRFEVCNSFTNIDSSIKLINTYDDKIIDDKISSILRGVNSG